MEVSALKYRGGLGLHARSPMLRLQSDERLVAFTRRGNVAAFETLVGRYETRLLAFCRHLLGSREDAEDILQEVMAAAFNAILADERPIKVRPWLYRIARNRCLNHLRRNQALGVDSMDVHFSDNGASTADKVHDREEFRLLVGDIHDLPETQRTALVLREMDALSYEQIAEAMETTVPSVKSLLVRARVSLAEAAEARLLSCEEVRLELGEVAEGLRRRPGALVRRHLRSCDRCSTFRVQLRETNKALAALLPFGPLVVLKKLVFTHLGHSAGTGAAGSGAGAAGSGAAAGSGTAAAGSAVAATGAGAGGVVSAGIGAVATKAVAGLAVTAIVTAGAVEVGSSGRHSVRHTVASAGSGGVAIPLIVPAVSVHHAVTHNGLKPKPQNVDSTITKSTKQDANQTATTNSTTTAQAVKPPPVPAGRTVVNNDTTNLAGCASTGGTTTSTTGTTTTPTTTTAPCASAASTDSSAGGGGSISATSTQPPADGSVNPTDGGGAPPAGGQTPPAGGQQPPPDGGSSGTQTTGGGTPPTPGSGTGTTGGGGSVSGAPPTSLQ
jgi:RNA polymerase sigma factor (sigma-70 family)